jgi:hypothetical protein
MPKDPDANKLLELIDSTSEGQKAHLRELLAREVPHVPRRGNLRDEFAAAALTGILANAGLCNDIGDEDVATYAYDYADAMIDARNKK